MKRRKYDENFVGPRPIITENDDEFIGPRRPAKKVKATNPGKWDVYEHVSKEKLTDLAEKIGADPYEQLLFRDIYRKRYRVNTGREARNEAIDNKLKTLIGQKENLIKEGKDTGDIVKNIEKLERQKKRYNTKINSIEKNTGDVLERHEKMYGKKATRRYKKFAGKADDMVEEVTRLKAGAGQMGKFGKYAIFGLAAVGLTSQLMGSKGQMPNSQLYNPQGPMNE